LKCVSQLDNVWVVRAMLQRGSLLVGGGGGGGGGWWVVVVVVMVVMLFWVCENKR
jgi:hypothetical protein